MTKYIRAYLAACWLTAASPAQRPTAVAAAGRWPSAAGTAAIPSVAPVGPAIAGPAAVTPSTSPALSRSSPASVARKHHHVQHVGYHATDSPIPLKLYH